MRLLLFTALLAATAAHAEARQPAPKGKGEPRPDGQLIRGNWHIVGLETRGKAEPDRNYRGNTFHFARVKGVDTATLREGRLGDIEFAYKLDPDASPKSIDLVLPTKNVTFRGIYKLDGDDLTLCVSNGGPRPTEFATKAGSDVEIFTLKRDRWVAFAAAGHGITVELPANPEERRRDVDLGAGPTTATLFVAKSDMERATYVVAVARLPGKRNAKEADAAASAVRTAAVEEVYPGARPRQVEKKAPPKGPGPAAQEFSLTLDLPGSKDRATALARQFVAGDRVYVLLAAGPDDAIKPESVSRFWNSFRPPAGKKGKN